MTNNNLVKADPEDMSGSREVLVEEFVTNVSVVGDWVFYVSDPMGKKIGKIRTDSSDREDICDLTSENKNIVFMYADESYVYFSQQEYNAQGTQIGQILHRMGHDGENDEQLGPRYNYQHDFYFTDEHIYFFMDKRDPESTSTLSQAFVRMDYDGGDVEYFDRIENASENFNNGPGTWTLFGDYVVREDSFYQFASRFDEAEQTYEYVLMRIPLAYHYAGDEYEVRFSVTDSELGGNLELVTFSEDRIYMAITNAINTGERINYEMHVASCNWDGSDLKKIADTGDSDHAAMYVIGDKLFHYSDGMRNFDLD
jgi:hypothetical protein